jgi:YidC/Oxa1 family membrane protein insertase
VPVGAETPTLVTPLATDPVSSIGAAPVGAEMQHFRSLRPDARDSATVELARAGDPLLRYRLVVPLDTTRVADSLIVRRDTISLHDVAFAVSRGAAPAAGPAPVIYEGATDGVQLRIAYSFAPDSYQVHVEGAVRGAPAGSYLLLDFADGLRSSEADVNDDQSHLAFAYKPVRDDANSVAFRKLDPGEARLAEGPLSWAVLKNKYFLFGLLAPEQGTPFAELHVTGGARTGKVATNAEGSLVLPVRGDGAVEFSIYAGPQEWRRLLAVGRDFENVNPYGGWLNGVVQPFATIVMRILLWMKDTTHLNYGWVLVIFGVAVRVAMWPLNQSAMRSQIKMQRLQPEMEVARKKYPNDVQKQQEEIMKVYKAHGMSPLSPIAGCLPMMLPMPILFALFYVFQNTIEFRGVSFLWLPDLSLHDPTYITPILMGVTMFVVSWIGLRAAPPNAQTKLMAYAMPLTFTVLFARMAAGLNLYYAVQNLASIPQQWLIAHERKKATPGPGPVVQGTPTPSPKAARKRA